MFYNLVTEDKVNMRYSNNSIIMNYNYLARNNRTLYHFSYICWLFKIKIYDLSCTCVELLYCIVGIVEGLDFLAQKYHPTTISFTTVFSGSNQAHDCLQSDPNPSIKLNRKYYTEFSAN